MTKLSLYALLVADLSPFWYRDLALLERNPEKWQLAREIDDFLYTYRNNPRVSVEQFERNCIRLRDIYAVGPKTDDPPSVQSMPCPETEAPQMAKLDDLEGVSL